MGQAGRGGRFKSERSKQEQEQKQEEQEQEIDDKLLYNEIDEVLITNNYEFLNEWHVIN